MNMIRKIKCKFLNIHEWTETAQAESMFAYDMDNADLIDKLYECFHCNSQQYIDSFHNYQQMPICFMHLEKVDFSIVVL